DLVDAAEVASRRGARLVGRHPTPHVLVGEQIEVRVDFLAQVGVAPSSTEPGKKPRHELAKRRFHGALRTSQSCRSATAGSIRTARQAGTAHASDATATRSAAEAPYVVGSS